MMLVKRYKGGILGDDGVDDGGYGRDGDDGEAGGSERGMVYTWGGARMTYLI